MIYTFKIEGWEKIKNKSHWKNAILTDSTYPIAAKHFAFAFETTDLHNLLHFEYSLIDDQEKLLQFQQGENKIPALSLLFKSLHKMLKVKKNPKSQKSKSINWFTKRNKKFHKKFVY